MPVKLAEAEVAQIMREIDAQPGAEVTVDLQALTVTSPSGTVFTFDIAGSARHNLLNGLDAIGLTLAHADMISRYEENLPAWRA